MYYKTFRKPKGLLSAEEKRNLLIAISALTLALTNVMAYRFGGIGHLFREDPLGLSYLAITAVVSVGTGFALHELAHKFVAQRYGCWAEFRYSLQGLLIALFISLFGFLYAAPGAVYIVGRISDRQNGIISIAGPATNVVVAVALLPFVIMGEGLMANLLYSAVFFNAFLAIFNMIPIMPLDGAKVLKWNVGLYAAAAAGMGILLIFVWFGLPSMEF
jgi:Zn-dependent protease